MLTQICLWKRTCQRSRADILCLCGNDTWCGTYDLPACDLSPDAADAVADSELLRMLLGILLIIAGTAPQGDLEAAEAAGGGLRRLHQEPFYGDPSHVPPRAVRSAGLDFRVGTSAVGELEARILI